jgi:iron-sulfur cluster insertion protein
MAAGAGNASVAGAVRASRVLTTPRPGLHKYSNSLGILASTRKEHDSMTVDSSVDSEGIIISPSAVRRIARLKELEANDGLMLRIAVSGGGCSGFQYGFSLDDTRRADDRLFIKDGVGIVVDEVSLDLLRGSQVDYVEDLVGAYFAVNNPNAASTCGCGSSFSV